MNSILKDLMKFNTLDQLKDIARLYELPGFSRLKKSDLAELLVKTDVSSGESTFSNTTIKQLKVGAKKLRLRYGGLNKTKLFNLVFRNRNNKPIEDIETNTLTLSQLKGMTNRELIERIIEEKGLKRLTKQKLINKILSDRKPEYKLLDKAFRGFLKSYNVAIVNDKDPLGQITITRPVVSEILTKQVEKSKGGVQFSEVLHVHFMKENMDGTIQRESHYFRSKSRTVMNLSEIAEEISTIGADINTRVGVWTHNGSGWIVERVSDHHINISKNKPLSGGSYIELPTELRHSRKGLLNIKNSDTECLRWYHIRHINPMIINGERVSKKDRALVSSLNYKGVTFPIKTKDYNKIEVQNDIHVCISVFGYENKEVFPIYVSKEKFEKRMELLLITSGDNKRF